MSNLYGVYRATKQLRAAQKAYMRVRGDEKVSDATKQAHGRIVGAAAEAVDDALAVVDPEMLKVLDIIMAERQYQKDMEARGTTHVVEIGMGSILLAMEENLRKAREAWYNGRTPHRNTMTYVRKVAALAIQAGEKFGVPRR